MTAKLRTRDLAVYDGQKFVGLIKVADDDGSARAFDQDGRFIGCFPSLKAASAAFNTPAQQR